MGSGWNSCIYPSEKITGQASLISMVFSCLCAALVHRNHLFCLYQNDKSSASNVKFRQASNHCKKVLIIIAKAAKLTYASKTKESITSQKHGSCDFWRIANSVLSKGKSATPPLFSSLEVLACTTPLFQLIIN